MNTPEDPNFWEEQLGDIDLTGFRAEGSLLDQVYAETDGTPEQKAVLAQVREILKPYEQYLHQQAKDCTTSALPKGVKKSPFRNTYKFTVQTDGNEKAAIAIQVRKAGQNIQCESFKMDGHSVRLNKQGKITQIRVRTSSEGQGIWVVTEKASKMGLFTEGYNTPDYLVQNDGHLPTVENKPSAPFPKVVLRLATKAIPLKRP